MHPASEVRDGPCGWNYETVRCRGVAQAGAARQAGMERQTLRDWVHRFNAQGRPARRLTAAQEAEVRARVLAGPDPETDGLARWRCTDVQSFIAGTHQVQYHVRSIGKLLHKLRLSHVSVRPVHPESDVEAQESFKKLRRRGRRHYPGPCARQTT